MEYFDDLNTELENDRMDVESTIFVKNLPLELDEGAIRDIFCPYGKIIHMYYATNARWTYITYRTYCEAELAIRELDGKKPLCLKVTLSKRSLNDKSQNSYVSQDLEEKMFATNVAEPPSAHTDIKYRQSTGRGQPVNAIHKYSKMSQITNVDSKLLQSPHSQAFNFYESDDHSNTSRLWSRGVQTITPDGKRHVVLGRGYTLYKFPEECPETEEYIKKLYEERRLKESYEYGEDKFKDRLQKCYICSTKTTKRCEKCFTYYCSRSCQVKDWPRHKIECERIPALVEETVQNISTLQISKEKEEKKASKSNAINKIASNEIKLRRPNTPQSSTNVQSNGVNAFKTEKVDDQSVNSAIKDFSQQNQRPKYNKNINRNMDQSKGDEDYFTKANSTRQNYNHSRNVTNRINKDRIDNNVKDKSYNTDQNQSDQRYKFQNNRKPSPYGDRQNDKRSSSASSNSNTDDDILFNKDTYLSDKEFTEIEIVVPLHNNEYWVTKVKDANAIKNLMIQLQNVAAKSCNMKPIIGNIYGVLYDTIWHRAMVISLNPVMVHFIDFGNDEILDKNADIKDIEDMAKIPKFARKIQLTPATIGKYKNLQHSDKISVRMLSMNTDKTIIVEVQNPLKDLSVRTQEGAPQSKMSNTMETTVSQEKYEIPPNIIKASKIQIPNILDAFADLLTQAAVAELKIRGAIEIIESTDVNVYSATLCPDIFMNQLEMILQNLQKECNDMEKSDLDCRPQVEDLVCGKSGNGWYRGYVLDSSYLHIITVEEAKILPVDKILPCPENFSNICAFGIVCRVDHPTIKLEVGSVYVFSTTLNRQNCKEGSLKIDITINDEVLTAVIKPWESLIIKSVPALAELKSGSKICLTSYRNQCVMYARSLNDSEVEYYNDTMQRIAQCARSAPNLSESPGKGKIVIAPFCDGNDYRAMVLEVKDDKAKIAYIDFGNIDYISIKELKVLPEDLARQRSCSAKIVLKDVPRDAPMTIETDQYLRNLTGKEVPLTCIHEGAPSKDGVYLTMPTGESVNDEINKLLLPSWKQQKDDDEKRYMLDDIPVISLGRVGDTVKALIRYIQKVGKQYMLSPIDVDALRHLYDVMSPMMKEYCEKTTYYIPRVHELCLALYEGAWYRAACLDSKNTDTTAQIFFIDYGNIESVKHQNIRQMPKDFVTPAAMANLCTVVNLAPLDSDGNYSPAVQKKIKDLVPDQSVVTIKIVNYIENGDYEVEFPDVRAKLIEGNFIQSAEKF